MISRRENGSSAFAESALSFSENLRDKARLNASQNARRANHALLVTEFPGLSRL